MEVERPSDLSGSEQGALIEELGTAAAWPRKMRLAFIVTPLIGAILCFCVLAFKQEKNNSLLHSTLDGDVTDMHIDWVNDCGGYDDTKLSDFSHGYKGMIEAGWVFSARGGHWAGGTAFRPPIAGFGLKVLMPDPNSYWGWDYPGNGMLRLRLHCGENKKCKFHLDVANAWWKGLVKVAFDNKETIADVPAKTRWVVTSEFKDRQNLTLYEYNPRGILVINSIKFECHDETPAPVIGKLRESQKGPGGTYLVQYVSGASWELKDFDCKLYSMIGAVQTQAWDGSQSSESARTWCGDACLVTGSNTNGCDAFAYPDPGIGEPRECKIAKRKAAGEEDMCSLGLDPQYWAFHVLKEVAPQDYPDASQPPVTSAFLAQIDEAADEVTKH